jgi:23S rRNA pseudouridine1911/1915/1917 synthase
MYFMHVGKHRDAKEAVTHFQTERSANGRTLLNVQLDTGRQHQIRAHMAWLKHPVVGDPRYGTAGPRLGLHALSLSFRRPKTGKRISVTTPATRDFYQLLEE